MIVIEWRKAPYGYCLCACLPRLAGVCQRRANLFSNSFQSVEKSFTCNPELLHNFLYGYKFLIIRLPK